MPRAFAPPGQLDGAKKLGEVLYQASAWRSADDHAAPRSAACKSSRPSSKEFAEISPVKALRSSAFQTVRMPDEFDLITATFGMSCPCGRSGGTPTDWSIQP